MIKFKNVIRYLLIILICLTSLAPFMILLMVSLNSPKHNFYNGSLFIPDFDIQNYIEGWIKSNIGRAMINSAVITIGALLLIVFLGAMAGYSISRFKFKINKVMYTTLLVCMMVPGIINTVPLYTLMIKLNAINTLWGMSLVCATLAMPASVFIFTKFIKDIPIEIEEAAIIDGCSRTKVFFNIILPLLKPSISAVVILNGFGIWNNYAQAVFFLQDSSKHNVPQALSVYFQQFAGAKWNLMAATATIAIIPTVIAFLVFQKKLMGGLTDGAIKG